MPDPLPDLEQFRAVLLLMAEIELSPHLRVKVDAADLVQETLLEAHRDRASFRGKTEAELLAWLKTILFRNLYNAVRRFRTRMRDWGKEFSLADRLDQSSAQLDKFLASEQTSPSQRASKNEQLQQLAEGLARLLEAERTAVILKHLHGWSLADMSTHLGRPVDAVAGLLKRGLKKLREYLRVDEE